MIADVDRGVDDDEDGPQVEEGLGAGFKPIGVKGSIVIVDKDADEDRDSQPQAASGASMFKRRKRHDSPDMGAASSSGRHNTASSARVRHDSPDLDVPRRRPVRHDSPDFEAPRKPPVRHDSPDLDVPRRPAAGGNAREAATPASAPALRRTRHDSPDLDVPRRPIRHDSPDLDVPRKPPSTATSTTTSAAHSHAARHDSPDLDVPRRPTGVGISVRGASPDLDVPRRPTSDQRAASAATARPARHDSPDLDLPRKPRDDSARPSVHDSDRHRDRDRGQIDRAGERRGDGTSRVPVAAEVKLLTGLTPAAEIKKQAQLKAVS